MELKPQFGAPGAGVITTVYYSGYSSYGVFTGASLASAFVTRVIALIAEARKTLDPELIENLLSSTAKPQAFHDYISLRNFLAPTFQQGAGLIQAYDAAYATTLLNPSSLSFNDTPHFVESRQFSLTNMGEDKVSYRISHVSTATFYSLTENLTPQTFLQEIEGSHAAELLFSQDQISLNVGETIMIEVRAKPPAREDLDIARLPIWSGWVAVNGSDGSALSLPYLGLSGSLSDAITLMPGYFNIFIPETSKFAPENYTLYMPRPGSPEEDEIIPEFFSPYFVFGTSLLHADVVPLMTPPDWAEEVDGVTSIGELDGLPRRWFGGDGYELYTTVKLSNGRYWPEGRYKVRARALRINGDENDRKDWDYVETLAFYIKYKDN
jgi:hypothetical protein